MKLKTLHEEKDRQASDWESMHETMKLVAEYLKENGIEHYDGWSHMVLPKHKAKLVFYDDGDIRIAWDAHPLGLWVNILDPESFPKMLEHLRTGP